MSEIIQPTLWAPKGFPVLVLFLFSLSWPAWGADVPLHAAHELRSNTHNEDKQYSAICVVAKDENRYVREWVDYHKCLGIDHIYLYDHNSTEPLSTQIQDFIQDGFVTYHGDTAALNHTRYKEGFSSNYARFMTTVQGQVYKDCMSRYGSRHTFMGFIDIDEFVVFHDTTVTNMNGFLKEFEEYGGVSLYWVLFGSSGHVTPPTAWVTSAYTKCTPAEHFVNTQFKTFVNTKYWPTMYSPHRAQFELNSRQYLVNEFKERIPAGRNDNSTHQRAAVYHYATRSKADFLGKLRRGGGAGVTRPPHFMRKLDSQCSDTCNAAVETYTRFCHARNLPSHMNQDVTPWMIPGYGAAKSAARHRRDTRRLQRAGLR